ncbi:MAG: HNH endonuclease [Propionibacteriaceae bacterium]|nr:HNH endonuclease [Propionibacteriaceae bacterium]
MCSAVSYRVGIDVGLGGVGVAAIAVDPDDIPFKILNAQVLAHDSGVDPDAQKTGISRLATAGVARRTRRLLRRRRKRLQQLDKLLTQLGYPVSNPADAKDPYAPWRVRAELAQKPVDNAAEKKTLLSIAVRHMARHRGWRNPYASVAMLHQPAEDSRQFIELKQRIAEALCVPELEGSLTPAQVVALHALSPAVKMRGATGVLGGKLMQSDNANELRRIAEVQGIPEDELRQLIDAVFKAESPRGSAAKRVGKDPLPGQGKHDRAPKAHPAFQRFRIVATLANMRIRLAGNRERRRLTSIERHLALDYLLSVEVAKDPLWSDLAERLGVDRHSLIGAASASLDGERPSARPPVDETDRRIRESKISSLIAWWEKASRSARDAMVEQVAFCGSATDSTPDGAEAEEFLMQMSEEDLAKLDQIRLPAGRAAYSVPSLVQLTKRMLDSEDDLYDARIHLFGVAADWRPPAEPIAAPVGNPAVDRVAKLIARWLSAVEREWGAPISVNIEHVREGLSSDVTARKVERENNRRYLANQKLLAEIHQRLGLKSKPTRSDLWRYQAICRQNSQCAYCGQLIDFFSAEMDHIVPRSGVGSSNTRDNLLAVCSRCNRAKSNQIFADWAEACDIPHVSVADAVERLRHWAQLSGMSRRDHLRFQADVKARLLRRSEDPEIDARSMESVAWMANELRNRIDQHFQSKGTGTTVSVYRGQLTAEARKASGLEGRLHFLGGAGKTRLDRRHHVMDAATISLMEPSISRSLAERISLRDAQRLTRTAETWKEYRGATQTAQDNFRHWQNRMLALSDLLNKALLNDEIPVVQPLRLRYGNGSAHDDTIRKLHTVPLSAPMPLELIDRASTPALWCALTRQQDFDSKTGLPENAERRIVVQGKKIGPTDTISFFPKAIAAIAVRNGYAEIGSTIHHARVYRFRKGRETVIGMVRVFGTDIQKHRKEDLFSVPLPPQCISVRRSNESLRAALSDGTAEYLGWLVVGDELKIDMSSFNSGQIGGFLTVYPSVNRWRVDGFESETRLRLRPTLLSAEGLREDSPEPVRKTLDRPGWRISISALWASGRPTVIRRDALGRERLSSAAHLPVSWEAAP